METGLLHARMLPLPFLFRVVAHRVSFDGRSTGFLRANLLDRKVDRGFLRGKGRWRTVCARVSSRNEDGVRCAISQIYHEPRVHRRNSWQSHFFIQTTYRVKERKESGSERRSRNVAETWTLSRERYLEYFKAKCKLESKLLGDRSRTPCVFPYPWLLFEAYL